MGVLRQTGLLNIISMMMQLAWLAFQRQQKKGRGGRVASIFLIMYHSLSDHILLDVLGYITIILKQYAHWLRMTGIVTKTERIPCW